MISLLKKIKRTEYTGFSYKLATLAAKMKYIINFGVR